MERYSPGRQIVKYFLIGLALECFSCLAFILLFSQTSLGSIWKPVLVTATVAGIWLVFIIAAKHLKLKSLLLLALLLAFGYTVFESTIGFLWFPGIVKDIEFGSLLQMKGFLAWTTFLTVMHAFVACVCQSLWILFTKRQQIDV